MTQALQTWLDTVENFGGLRFRKEKTYGDICIETTNIPHASVQYTDGCTTRYITYRLSEVHADTSRITAWRRRRLPGDGGWKILAAAVSLMCISDLIVVSASAAGRTTRAASSILLIPAGRPRLVVSARIVVSCVAQDFLFYARRVAWKILSAQAPEFV